MLRERRREAPDSGAGGLLHTPTPIFNPLPIPISGGAARGANRGDPDPPDGFQAVPCLPAAFARTGVASMEPEVFARRKT